MSAKNHEEHVFVVGASRSGTTLVHLILLSCSVYTVYRAETQLLNGCDRKYGNLKNRRSRESFLSDWFRSRQFLRSGLTKAEFLELLNSVGTPSYIRLLGDFMNRISAKQQCNRWVDSTPGNIYSLAEIADCFPNAKVIHLIRDGRAVALSRAKLGWSGVSTNNFDRALGCAALMWEKSVLTARKAKHIFPQRYIELRYEELIENPECVLDSLSEFLNIPKLDYAHINKDDGCAGKGSAVAEYSNNSAFNDLPTGISTKAAYRWKNSLNREQISRIESFVGQTLQELDYPLISDNQINLKYSAEKIWCKSLLKTKSYVKKIPSLGRIATTPLEIDVE